MGRDQERKPDVRCPRCKNDSLYIVGAMEGEVRCNECDARFPVHNGVINLLPKSTGKRKFGQVMMEWEPIIRIYESRYWRKSHFFALRTGIHFDQEFQLVTKAADFSGNEVFLDLACGPGIYTRPIARTLKQGHVVGLDLSTPMLNHLSRRAVEEGIRNLTLIRGSALDLPFGDQTFDAVNCCGALHLFPDVARALVEISRVLMPEGRFTSAVFGKPSGTRARMIGDFYYRKLGINSFLAEEFELLLQQTGFRDVTYLHKKEGWGWLVTSAIKK